MLIEIEFQFLLKFLDMQKNTATEFLPIVADEQRVEVALEGGEAVIRLSTWSADLGWCTQKTLRIEAAMLDDLHRVIASARYRSKRNGEEVESAKVIDFPR